MEPVSRGVVLSRPVCRFSVSGSRSVEFPIDDGFDDVAQDADLDVPVEMLDAVEISRALLTVFVPSWPLSSRMKSATFPVDGLRHGRLHAMTCRPSR